MMAYSIDKYVLLQFKSSLREQAVALRESINRAETEIRGIVDPHADAVDLSICNATKEALVAQRAQNFGNLRLVELALERIQNGTFAECVACGDAIGLKRLQAIPSATRCIECQQGLERGEMNVVVGANGSLEGGSIENTTR